MKLNEKLVKLRKESGMTQEELAAKLFVTRTAVSKWENDKGYPAIDSLKLLSQIYGVSLDELISEDDVANVRIKTGRRSRAFFGCAAGCAAAAVIFALAARFSAAAWLIIPSVAMVAAYVAFAFLSKPVRGSIRRDRRRHIAARAVVLVIVVAAAVTTFVQIF